MSRLSWYPDEKLYTIKKDNTRNAHAIPELALQDIANYRKDGKNGYNTIKKNNSLMTQANNATRQELIATKKTC